MKYELPKFEADFEINKLIPYELFSPGMMRVVEYKNENSEGAFDTDISLEQMRENYIEERKFWNNGGPEPFKVEEINVECPSGEIPVRLYYPDDKEVNSLIVFVHGGGYVVGNNDTHNLIMRRLMQEAGAIVAGVDYSLAPEYKFPTQLFEVVASIDYLHHNASNYGIDPDDISIAGDSGGGNLALAANLYLRDMGENYYITSLLLYYPTLGLRDSRSMRLYGWDVDGMRKKDLDSYNFLYIDNAEDSENPYCKLINSDLSYGIPPTYLSCGNLDPLLDDSLMLYDILKNHKIKSEIDILDGVLHGFMHYSKFMDEANIVFEKSGKFYKIRKEF